VIISYVDSSVVVAILFGERAASRFQRHLARCDEIVSASLLEAEVLAAAKREDLSIAEAAAEIDTLSLITCERSLQPEYHRIFGLGYCRGTDALHLATALYLDPDAETLTFLTADKPQAQLARKLGLMTP
jgi:predicted nucleic acid-binding protein